MKRINKLSYVTNDLEGRRSNEAAEEKEEINFMDIIIIMMVFIFYMSQQTGQVSSGQSGKIVLLLSKIGIEISQDNISKITFIIRKSAHFSEYFVLYILLFNVIKNYIHSKKIILYSIMGVIIYAASDEFHQYVVPGRSAAIKDVFIDTCGGIAASIVNNLFYKVKNMIKI